MPELAEVEYYRRRWDRALGQRISAVAAHPEKRVFRSISTRRWTELLRGSILHFSEARGKLMLFRLSKKLWLGLHLGMTGELRVERPDFKPAKHDHLVLYQNARALVFSDPRLFGQIRFHQGAVAPAWWSSLPPSLLSKEFTQARMAGFLHRHRRLPIKATLLLQAGFPGVGNWMADEILWRARVHPRTLSGALEDDRQRILWRAIRLVARGAMKHISPDFSDPPPGWFFNERWGNGGKCPVHGVALARDSISGRTTVWCSRCQP